MTAVKPLPSLRRTLTQPSILTLACKKANSRKTLSKTPSGSGRPKGFSSATPSSPRPNAPSNGPPVATQQTQVKAPGNDDLTLYQLGRMLSDARAYYRNNTEVPQETVRRNLHSQRFENLPLHRCSTGPSTISGAGQGLFATRDIAAGELITCYPGDAILCWEDADHSAKRNIEVYHGNHIVRTEANALRFVHELRSYEVPASETLSIVGDPLLCGDAVYLGHMANDGACPDFSSRKEDVEFFSVVAEEQAQYDAASVARANAEHITLEGCHVITRATRPICAGDEVFVTYGYGYWLSRRQPSQPPATPPEIGALPS